MRDAHNVFYDYNGVTKKWCLCNMDKETAQEYLAKFKAKYQNADGTPKAFPNGQGFYPIANPRVLRVTA